MREEAVQRGSEEESDSSHASADAARLHAVARRMQLREHFSRQQQLQLHKQLQQQQQLLQQQQQQLHQQDTLLRHQEQLLRQQEQQLASRETEAGLLLRQVGLLQQQLEERADRLATAEGNYLDAASLLQQLQQRVAQGAEARQLVEEVRQQQQQDLHHLYAEVRRLKRQLSLSLRACASSDEGEREKDGERAAEGDLLRCSASMESFGAGTATVSDTQQQQQQQADELPFSRDRSKVVAPYDAGAAGFWCCAEAAEAVACTAWGCSACCCCSVEAQHEAAVEELRVALERCCSAVESRCSSDTAANMQSARAASAAVLAVKEAVSRCPAAAADPEIVDILLDRLRAESMQVRVYAQQRHAAAAAGSSSCTVQQQQQQVGLTVIDEATEREAYEVMGAALPLEVLLLLLATQSISTLLRLKQQSVLLANSRWLQLLRETAGNKFLEGSCCCAASGSSTLSCSVQQKSSAAAAQPGEAGDSSGSSLFAPGRRETLSERRQHVLLQLLLRGSGGVAAAAGLLRHSTVPLALHAATLTDRESGNNVFHLLCLRNLPQLFGMLNLASLPCELIYAQNGLSKTPADLLPPLLPSLLLQLRELQEAAAAGSLQQEAELQQQLSVISGNLRAWRGVVFEYAAKASTLYRQHMNEAALSLYSEALKLQQRLLGKQQQLDETLGGNGASSYSLLENTAKLAFNKARSALRLGRWICSLQSCSFCLSMTPSYKAAYETAAEACEWLLDFEGALNYIQLMRQHCPDAFSSDHYHKRRLYEAQVKASSFQVLGIERGAPKAAINRAFRRLSIVWHPDKASALSEDLRLRHENHFKRLNEARIALLDAKSYARQLLIPPQPMYRHPELLAAPTPPQQLTPSSLVLQPAQLTSEQQQHDQQQQHQQQREQQQQQQQHEQKRETEEVEPNLERLHQQRQQLLRSIGSLTRQQHEVQRELEEQRTAAPQRIGSSSASDSLRWQELQKLQQQQQNKQKRLAECETEIDHWLHRQQQQQQQQQQQEQQQQQQDSQEAKNESEDGISRQSSPDQDWRYPEQQQQQQQQQRRRGSNQSGDSQVEVREAVEGTSQSSAPQASPSDSPAAAPAAAAAAAAAEVLSEAAAATMAAGDEENESEETSPWATATSSDSDTELCKKPRGGNSAAAAAASISSSSSPGFATAATSVPSPPQTRQETSPASVLHPSSIAAAAAAGQSNAWHTRENPRVCSMSGRGGSRASSAGPPVRSGEAAAAAAAAAIAKATARRSLTTCICSASPRRAAAAPRTSNSTQLKGTAAYWAVTDSSSSSDEDSSSSSSSSSGNSISDAEVSLPERRGETQRAASSDSRRSKFSASVSASLEAVWPGIAGQMVAGPVQQQQEQHPLPIPTARRTQTAHAAGREASGTPSNASSSGSSNNSSNNFRDPLGRRSFLRTRGSPQQHPRSMQQQRLQQQKQQQQKQQQQKQQQQKQQEQQRHRQQLWPGPTCRTGGIEGASSASPVAAPTAASTPATTATAATPTAGTPQAAAAPAAAAAAAWLRPPEFPERPPQQQEARQSGTPEPHHQLPSSSSSQQQQQHFENFIQALGQQQSESERQKLSSIFQSPGMMLQFLDIQHLRQQQVQQQQQQQRLLQRKLQEQREIQEARDSARHQLLFPDEELYFRDTRTAAAAKAAEATAEGAAAAAAPAAASRLSPTSPKHTAAGLLEAERAAAFGALGATPPSAGAAEKANLDKRCRWPVPPQSVSVAAADRSLSPPPSSSIPAGITHITNLPHPPIHSPVSAAGGCTPEVQDQHKTNGASNARESCDSGDNSSPNLGCSSKSNTSESSRSDGEAQQQPHGSGQWRPPPYNQQQQQQQQQQERLYRSLGQETPQVLRSPREGESIYFMEWGMRGGPHRNSVPLLGRTNSASSSNIPLLRKDAAATATPTRLFPEYGSPHLGMQHAPNGLRFEGPRHPGPGEGDSSTAAADAAFGGHATRGTEEAKGAGDVADRGGYAVTSSLGVLHAQDPHAGDAFPSLASWQPLLTRSSQPSQSGEPLLHTPRRNQQMW